jgi:hypothetical protein
MLGNGSGLFLVLLTWHLYGGAEENYKIVSHCCWFLGLVSSKYIAGMITTQLWQLVE